jgi:molybdopterin-guanine dinucleotide biosynthesis protein A/glyoxylase-like metal-dependent hydrolase (beta-lactamase superfamily II)
MSSATEASLAGIVLAGGSSERFGRNKLLETFRGRPLLHHAIDALLELCDRVVVVASPRGPEVPVSADSRVEVTFDDVSGHGPMVGLRAGLGAIDADWTIVVGGDMPELQAAVLREMGRAGRETGATVVALSDAGDARPLPIVVRVAPAREAVGRLLLSGRLRLRDLLAEVETVVIDEPTWTALDPDRRTLFDVDEPSDLEGGRSAPVPHRTLSIGPFEVTPLCDGWAPLPLDDEMPGADVDWEAERERFPWAFPADDPSSWAWHVHAFLVRREDGIVLVDTGIGHFGRPPFDVVGRLDDELSADGVAPAQIDHVVLTHLHADHSGAACTPDGRPRFPNARYHVHPADWSFFEEHRTPEDFTGRFAMSELETLGLLELRSADHEVAPGVAVTHAPGHTPGHRVVRLESGDGTLLLVGDLLHTPPQVADPGRSSNHDEDPELAARHRAELLARAELEGWTVGVSHFGEPFGRVERDGWLPV